MDKREKLFFLFIIVAINDLAIFIAYSLIYPYYYYTSIFNNWLMICIIIVTLAVEWSIFLYLLIKLKNKNMPLKLLIKRESVPRKELLTYSAIFAGVVISTSILLTLFYKVFYQINNLNLSIILIGGFTCAPTIGIVEETIWRAYIFNELKFEYDKKWKAIIYSSLSYSLFHGFEPIKLVVTFIIGITGCIVIDKIKNAWPLIISHAIAEFLAWTFYIL